jgi:hypothetical protein
MASATKNEFDAEVFRKLIARVDSSHPAEAETAFRKALLTATESGLSFADAIDEAFGRDDDTSQLKDENARLRDEVEERKCGGDKLADALDQAKQKIAELEREGTPEHRLWPVNKILWVLAAVIAARIVLYVALGEGPPKDGRSQLSVGFAPWLADILLELSVAWLLVQWHRAQRAAGELAQLILKWALLGPGLFLAVLIFFDGPPWDASAYQRGPIPALIAAALTILLVLSKFTERVAERIPQALGNFSLRGFISWVLGWFF